MPHGTWTYGPRQNLDSQFRAMHWVLGSFGGIKLTTANCMPQPVRPVVHSLRWCRVKHVSAVVDLGLWAS